MIFAVKRIGQALLVLVGVITLIFFVLRLVPGDPVNVIAPTATLEAKAELRSQLGLDLPLWRQYLLFAANAASGDFGRSYFFQGSAATLVLAALPYTVALAGSALGIALAFALPAGMVSAMGAGRAADRAVLAVCLLFQSAPNFWIALLLLSLVAIGTGLFPTVGYVGPVSLVLPATALSLSLVATLTQVLRNALVDVLRSEMVTAMRARGLSPRRILFVHGLRLSAVPMMTVIGAQLGYLLGGAVVVEYIFNYPGLGLLTLNAVLRRDYPLIQAVVLVTALIFLVLNLAIDMSYGLVDGRLSSRRRLSTTPVVEEEATA